MKSLERRISLIERNRAGKDEVATFYGVFDAGTPEHAAAEADPNRKGIMIVIHTVGPNGKFLDENGRGEDLNA